MSIEQMNSRICSRAYNREWRHY